MAAIETGHTLLAPNTELAAALFAAVERSHQAAGRDVWPTPRVRDFGGSRAIALAMFWNINFFRKLGFHTAPRDSLSFAIRDLSDFRDVRYRRSAVVQKSLDS